MTNDEVRAETLTDPIGRLVKLTVDLTESLRADLSTVVPDCPGWTLRDLIAHLGRVYGAVSTVIEQRASEPVRPGPEAFLAADADDDRARAWFDDRIEAVIGSLRSVDPATPVWTWSNERTAGFYHRRMVHETSVHFADVARALGQGFTIDREVCIDGVDEYFDVMLSRAMGRADAVVPSGSLHLHCTDGPGEWLVVPGNGEVVVTREHAKGAVAWRGPARALLLAVWGRVDPELDVVGDQTVSAEWLALAP